MKNKRFTAVLALILILSSSVSMEARRRRTPRRQNRSELGYLMKIFTNNQILTAAGISQSKANRIVQMINKIQPQISAIKEKIKAEYKSYHQALKANPVDGDRAMGAARRIHNMRWEIKEMALATRIKILSLFNSAEREKLDNAIKNNRRSRRNR